MINRKGSVIGLVLVITLATGIVVAGVLSLVNFQRNTAIRRELHFQANNLAETALDYAFAFVANDIKRNSVETSSYIPASGYKDFTFTTEAEAFLIDSIAGPTGGAEPTSYVKYSNLAVRVLPFQPKIKYRVPVTDPVNRLRAFAGQLVFETVVPVVARVTATYGDTGKSYTAYISKNIALNDVPMFQKAITYQGQLHLHRGYPILGGVHTNGNLALNAHAGDTARYNGMVSCAGRFYRGSAFDQGGTGADPYGYCPENAASEFDFSTVYTENISLAATNTSSLTIIKTDPTDGTITPQYEQVPTSLDSRTSGWKEQALTLFKNNLLDKSHQVPVMLPPGCSEYRLDDATTAGVNEFTNGTYKLLEPCIDDSTNPAYNPANIYKFERQARLVFRVECLYPYSGDSPTNETTEHTYKWIVKAYAKLTNDESRSDWTPLPMPKGIIGQTRVKTGSLPSGWTSDQYAVATCVAKFRDNGSTVTRSLEGLFEEFATVSSDSTHIYAINTSTAPTRTWYSSSGVNYGITGYDTNNVAGGGTSTQNMPAHGFFDARLGRGVSPITINMARLRLVLEGADLGNADDNEVAAAFRNLLGVSTTDYNGLIYVEFPTSLRRSTTASARAYKTGTTPYANDMTAIDSYAFEVGSTNEIELRHPDRMSATDSRKDRTDKILPIAKSLRGYPGSYGDSEIVKAKWAIPALQIVNGRRLPKIGDKGLTISTNAPIYLVGSYNCDGDFSTGTNITSTLPTDYAENDSANEISAGLFCDTMTVLSDTWGSGGNNAFRFQRSFGGANNYSTSYRTVSTGKVEISACVITGEYPIFEFFFHALENWQPYYSATNSPICFKGAVVGMFHPEIQHIKGAYGRNVNSDIQVYYHAHGAYAIPAVRLHEKLTEGVFPPGTPIARDYGQQSLAFLKPNSPADQALLSSAGF